MMFYDFTPAPNPWRVRIFLEEKGVEIPTTQVNLAEEENRKPLFLGKNSLGETPVLELDDGRCLTESVAICRYFEALHPEPPLFGRDPVDQAFVEMWSRRIEHHLMEVIGSAARHSFEFFKDRIEQNAAFAASQKRLMAKKWAWLDGELADGRAYIAGADFTVADIAGMAALKISDYAEEAVPAGLERVKAWEARVRNRPSWTA